jgi:hypothetical protein
MALIYSVKDVPQLIIVSVDGSPDRRIDLQGLTPFRIGQVMALAIS